MTQNEFWQRMFIVNYAKTNSVDVASIQADLALKLYSKRFNKDGNFIINDFDDDEDIHYA